MKQIPSPRYLLVATENYHETEEIARVELENFLFL